MAASGPHIGAVRVPLAASVAVSGGNRGFWAAPGRVAEISDRMERFLGGTEGFQLPDRRIGHAA